MAGPLALTGLDLWDGQADAAREAASVRIEDGRIVAVGFRDEGAALCRDARVLDFRAAPATALPGLVDAHVHLVLDPALGSPDEQARVPAEERERGMQRRAADMVRAGITTARDCGGGDWREIALRDRIAAGQTPGPRLACSGQPVTSPGGHCHFWGGEAAGPAEIREVVRRQIRQRADWIKVMATGGVLTRGTRLGAAQFSTEELRHVVEEAAAAGRFVAAHCHGTEGIRRAIEARVRTIEHCSFAGPAGFGADFDVEVARRTASADLWVSPTVNAGWGRRIAEEAARAPGAPPATGGPSESFSRRMGRVLRGLRESGARLVASTDAGIPGVEHHRLAQALPVLAGLAGLESVEVLRAATSEAARALGLAGETGALRAGFAADVLVVAGDPLRDLSALERPVCVVAAGRLVREPEAPASGG